MNNALPNESTQLGAPEVVGVCSALVALYVDADNQSPQCAKAVLSLLRSDLDARVVSATIAGNNHGQQVDCWRDELVSVFPDLLVHALTVPHRKQGADVALLMALGAGLERHLRERELVVIVSRDDLVIGAAEQAKAYGCRTLIAYVDSEIPTARNPHLTTLLLPAFAKPLTANLPGPVASPVAKAPDGTVTSVLAQLRGMCTQKPGGGGYAATDVGQALSKLGYDKVARARFLASVPGLVKRGTGTNTTLVF